MSVKNKILFWYVSILVVVFSIVFFSIFSISSSKLKENLKDSLIRTIEENANDVEYYYILTDEIDNLYNQYIEYQGGFIEIDEDFLDENHGITTGLYHENGSLMYGENPIGEPLLKKGFSSGIVQSVHVDGIEYYIFDIKLDSIGINGLWLRGTVSTEEALKELKDISRLSIIIICFILHLGVIIGMIIIEKILKPIRQITDAAIMIGNGNDLKKRINLGDGKDEFKTLANQFDKMVDRLDKAFDEEKRFTSDASHELRTPVSVITAQCEYTLESPRDTEEYIEALEVISRQSKKMSNLINDMLYLSRFEHKKSSYAFSQINFSDLVTEICKDMSLIEFKNIKLFYEIEDNIFISGEKELLERLISNFISNAYKYGKDGGETKVVLKKRDSNIYLSVSDNGIGIADEEKEKIFGRFYRSDKSRSTDGAGLGLSMALEIAQLHGGNITVESEPNKGSTFIFTM